MKSQSNVIDFIHEVSIEDMKCIINPLKVNDLKTILLMTHEDRRLDVVVAFLGIDLDDLFIKAGLGTSNSSKSKFNNSWYRWIRHESRLPLSAAFRVCKLIGIPIEILFSSPKWREGSCKE